MLAPASARAHDGLDDVDLDPWADADGPVVELAPEHDPASAVTATAGATSTSDTRAASSPSASASTLTASPTAPASASGAGSGKRRPFRTAPLTSLPRSIRPDPTSAPAHTSRTDPNSTDSGPRRRSTASTPRDSPEPYSAASSSAYAADALPSRSASHPLALDAATTFPKLTTTTPPRLGRLRSASHAERLSSPLSPLASPSLSPFPPSARPSSHSLTSSPAPSRPASSLTHPHPLPHPALAGLGGLGGTPLSDLRDVTRPGLARVTSETERAASVGSWSAASSDLADHDPDEEVDVVVHTVASGESMAGIALRYGIELAALRRANKLWPSDSLHLRTQLFVPLDACRASRDAWIVREEGGATLVRRRAGGRSRAGTRNGSEAGEGRTSGETDDSSPASPRTLNGNTPVSSPGTERGDPIADVSLQAASTSPSAQRNTNGNGGAGLEHIPLVVARVPASQLRFFPQQRRGGRSSLDSDASLGRNADSVRALASRSGGSGGGSRSGRGLFAALALDDDEEEFDEYGPRRPHRVTVRSGQYAPGATAASTGGSSTASPPASVSGATAGSGSVPASSLSPKSPTKKRNVVRLRPPAAQPPPLPGGGFAARISNFFTVPPPPAHLPPPTRLAPSSVDSSRRNSGADEVRREVPPELVEMDAKPPRKTDKKRD